MIPGIVAARRPAASGEGHRHWRVLCTNSQTFFALTQLQMRDDDGFDHAPDGTVSASSVYGTPYQPEYAVNGLSYQFWSTGGGQGGNGWIAVDFGSARNIVSVLMSNLSASRYPLAFDIQWSDDGSAWTTAWSGTMTDQAAGYVVSTAAGTTANATGGKRFRVRADATPAGGYTEFAEMLFYDEDGRPIVMSSGIASSNFSGYTPARLFDGDANTQWATATNSEAGAWAGMIAADDRDITPVSVTLTAGPGSEYNRSPSNFSVQESSDGGATWTTLWSVVGATWASGGQVQTFAAPPIPGFAVLPVVNPGAETGDTTGWTSDTTAFVAISTAKGGGYPGPHSGAYYFTFGNGARLATQNIDIPTEYHDEIDANSVAAGLRVWRNTFNSDRPRHQLAALDATGVELARFTPNWVTTPNDTWVQFEIRLFLPAGTRKVQVIMECVGSDGGYRDAYFDEVLAWLEVWTGAATSYSNAGGSGNRTAIITVTTENMSIGGGSAPQLVNGVEEDSFWWANGANNGTQALKFDFGSAKVINEILLTQSTDTSHGVWALEGSSDGVTYTQVGDSFTLAPYMIPIANTTAYRYYRLRALSGSRSQAPYLREIKFKIGA